MLVFRATAQVQTEDHLLSLSPDYPQEWAPGRFPNLPLATFAADEVIIHVGIRYGPVHVQLEVHDSAPPPDTDAWEDVAEGDFESRADSVALRGQNLNPALPADAGEKLTPPTRQLYRVRVHANGRAIEYDGPLWGDPVEDYLIQMWPTTAPACPTQEKNLSGV
jgi:hypothetical protein